MSGTDNNNTTNYLPSNPDYELRYPLSGNAEIVITHHSDRSYKHGFLLVGLSDKQVNALCHAFINGYEVVTKGIAGGKAEVEACKLIAESGGSPIDDVKVKNVTSRRSSSSSKPSSSKPRKRRRRGVVDSDVVESCKELGALGDAIDGMGKSDILDVSGLDGDLWLKCKDAMIEAGLWRQEGVKRGATYYWTGK